MPKVSIIVPTYNRCSYLRETISSILNQDYTDFEIIVTDNASTDGTAECIRSFEDARIVYFRQEANLGAGLNYNKALTLATGKYIHVFSDDDIMMDGCLSKKVQILDNYPDIGVVHSDINIIDRSGKVKSEGHYVFKLYKKWGKLHSVNRAFSSHEYHKYLYFDNIVCMPAVMLRRQVLDKLGNFDTNLIYLGDWQYWIKASLFFDFYYINERLVSYRVHDANENRKVTLSIIRRELKYTRADLKTKYSESLIIKSKLQEMALLLYYRAGHRSFYTLPLRRFIEFFLKGKRIEELFKKW